MMQGSIWISSNSQGHTQSMTLVLRLQIQPCRRGMFELGTFLEQSKSNSIFKSLQVILADDDDVNRTVTKKMLEKLGCRVSAVASGFECLSALLAIPGIHSKPLIIALTASAEEHVWERCLQMGMNGVIRKPVLLQGMADELRRVLQRANGV
ncbi:signal transduction histidine kinase, hybrid-type, ethylene sensor [Actinidia rufa]|uniref:Signal transduction histidine kinase, hybrid-type, ethylene sensor n=1 Tax=Actinidia rufa TaxID=165716 RepID=A0A7J0GUR0_9ERIC|nr:signal transduction histidine kinase, hybrid-type, ethylene sensor [Actinidia rufa]